MPTKGLNFGINLEVSDEQDEEYKELIQDPEAKAKIDRALQALHATVVGVLNDHGLKDADKNNVSWTIMKSAPI